MKKTKVEQLVAAQKRQIKVHLTCSTSLNEEEFNQVKAEAKRLNCTPATLIRGIIRAYFEYKEGK
jgi:F0F1-type ATP synthase delta subunit